jgi:tetratricopeptide (TPR) repeat protein
MGTGDKHSGEQAPSINELTRLAHKRLQKGDLQGAMEHYERAVEAAKLTSDPTVKISSYLNAGACLVSLGHYRRGLGLLESACKLLKKTGIISFDRDTELDRIQTKSSPTSSKPRDRPLLEMGADVYFNTAVAAQGLHDLKKSTSCFKISIDLYLKAGAKHHAADGFSSLAGCYQETDQLEQEIASLASAQQLYNELEDSSNEAMMSVELAKVYLRVGRKEECKRMITTAKLQALRVEDPKTQGRETIKKNVN